MFLIYHVTSEEHMFKGLCEFMDGRPTQWVTTLPYLVAITQLQMGIKSIQNVTQPHDGIIIIIVIIIIVILYPVN